MFTRDFVGVRVANIHHEQMDQDEKEIPLVVLACEINPFTPALAGELHDFVKRTLYTAAGAEVNSLLAGCKFNLELRPQEVQFRMATDQGKPSFTLAECKVGNIHAKRSKKSTAWTLGFSLTCSPASDKQLGQIVESYLKTKYRSFADAQATLFEDPETTKRRQRATGAADGPSESAAAH
jgi:hypothetical protein